MLAPILVLIGFVLYVIGAFGIMLEEFKESIIWGLFGLFTQVVNVLFAILYFKRCKKWLGYMLLGIILMLIGAGSAMASSL